MVLFSSLFESLGPVSYFVGSALAYWWLSKEWSRLKAWSWSVCWPILAFHPKFKKESDEFVRKTGFSYQALKSWFTKHDDFGTRGWGTRNHARFQREDNEKRIEDLEDRIRLKRRDYELKVKGGAGAGELDHLLRAIESLEKDLESSKKMLKKYRDRD